jgi:hypothetical protein
MKPGELASRLAATITEAMAACGPERPLLLTRPEVESMLRVSRSSVLRWQKSGLLTPVRLPGVRATRYKREEVEKLAGGSL